MISLAVTFRNDRCVKCPIPVARDRDRPFVNATGTTDTPDPFSTVLMVKTDLKRFVVSERSDEFFYVTIDRHGETSLGNILVVVVAVARYLYSLCSYSRILGCGIAM